MEHDKTILATLIAPAVELTKAEAMHTKNPSALLTSPADLELVFSRRFQMLLDVYERHAGKLELIGSPPELMPE